MTESFKASNGWYIDESGELRDHSDDKMLYPSDVQSAEQFFTERRDAELGRWRDKEHPEWVCYPDGADGVLVLNEKGGSTCVWPRALAALSFGGEITGEEIAARYFQAHPVRKPLPTVEGFYVNRSLFVQQVATTSILVHFEDGGWGFDDDLGSDATATAQKWHDAGELVQLTIKEDDE